LKRDLLQNPKIDLALEYLDLLRSTLPCEKFAAFLLLMLDVREKRFFFSSSLAFLEFYFSQMYLVYNRKTVQEVVLSVLQLLDGFPQLLVGFSRFLPPGYRIENRS
jgi:hypothetical protein